jgi:hypothetical protein
MRAAALILTVTLMFAGAARAADDAEPLPAGAPTEAYPMAAWCYGALSEYLDVYDRVKPDLRAIDKMFGSAVPGEKEPYASDMAAARVELKKIGVAVQAAEQASPKPIAPEGVAAINQGRAIWRPAEMKTHRELARAWLTWALPDRCASNAKELAASSALLGQALKYNNPSAMDAPAPAAPAPAEEPTPANPPAAEPVAQPAPEPVAPPSQPTTPSGPPPIGGYNSYLDKPAAGAAPSAPAPSDTPPADTPKTPGG